MRRARLERPRTTGLTVFDVSKCRLEVGEALVAVDGHEERADKDVDHSVQIGILRTALCKT